jgi:hypothetical protein
VDAQPFGAIDADEQLEAKRSSLEDKYGKKKLLGQQ